MRSKERPGQIDVFGCHAHTPVVLRTKAGTDIIEIGHRPHIDPGLRHRHHYIGAAKPEAVDQQYALVGIRNAFAHQVLAGDAEMDRPARQLRGDLACRQISDLDIIERADGAAIVPRATWLCQRKSGTREKGFRVFLQAAFGRNGEHEWRRHGALRFKPPVAGSRLSLLRASTQTENPTAGIGLGAPSWVISPS